jgi:dTDP-4-dehydrorhamnose reductase
LVFGAGGQLGREICRVLPDAVGLTRAEASVVDLASVMGAVGSAAPDVVFNCAAYNAVDRAEEESDLAFAINASGALNVAIACEHFGARLVHFSTNYVFDGEHDRPYVEADAVHPLGIYARSKAEGESSALSALPSALVIRTAAVYGAQGSAIKGGSFPERIVFRARAGDPLSVVADQTMNPTYAPDLAVASVGLAADGMEGVVHVVAEGCCSWHEFAVAVLAAYGVAAWVSPAATESLGAAAPRPPNGCLRSSRLEPLRHWQEALREWATPL